MIVVISGTVGVGKSTTSSLLNEVLLSKGYEVNYVIEEAAESPFLKYYYDEPEE
jgi:deoxyadenosine/deoxycytidine kinase